MKKNHEWDYIDLNFKGYANSVRTTDIKLSPPKPLPKDLAESQKKLLMKLLIQKHQRAQI